MIELSSKFKFLATSKNGKKHIYFMDCDDDILYCGETIPEDVHFEKVNSLEEENICQLCLKSYEKDAKYV